MNKQLKSLLKEYGVSQRGIANHMGITPQALTQRLNADDISLSTLQGIADAIHIELSELCAKMVDNHNDVYRELADLRKENIMLRALLAEKERTIEILIDRERR